MIHPKNRLLKSMSQKSIADKRYSALLIGEEPKGMPYEEVKFTPLNRSDFDESIINKWVEFHSGNAPKRRSFHSSFIYNNYLYIYGGKDISEGKLNDMWRVELKEKSSWEEVKPNTQFPYLTYHTGILIDNLYYIIAGQNEYMNQTNDVYIFSLENNNLEKIKVNKNSFPAIEMQSCAYYQEKKQIILFGGFTKGNFSNKLFAFDIESKTFNEIKYSNYNTNKKDNTIIPLPRGAHSSIIKDNIMYVFGGNAKDGKLLNDLWALDLSNNTWQKLSPDGVEDKYNIIEDEEVKENNNKENNNTESKGKDNNDNVKEVNEENEKQREIENDKKQKQKELEELYKSWPDPRSGHSMVIIGNNIYIFGGKVGHLSESNDFWSYDISSKKFTLLHDTMLEQYSPNELKFFEKTKAENAKDKKGFRLLNKKEMEDRKNPFSPNYIGKRSTPKLKLMRSASTANMKNIYEQEIFANSGFHAMKHSSIFNLDDKGVHLAIDNLNAILPFKIGKIDDDKLVGHLPLPRDGQSMVPWEDSKIILFGGDRNKFPFNDLYCFNI